MFQSYTVAYSCVFSHDGERAECNAKVLYWSREMIIINFQTTLEGENSKPVQYAVSEYCGLYWVANLEERVSIFIDDPLDTETTAECLQELDDLDEYEAEELAEIIRIIYAEALPGYPAGLTSCRITSEDLPF